MAPFTLSNQDAWISPGKLPKFLLHGKHPPENSFKPDLGFCYFIYLVALVLGGSFGFF